MIKELEEKRQGIIEISGSGALYNDFNLNLIEKIDNNTIKKLLSKDFDFETIELIYDISIPEIVDNLFVKNNIRNIRYVNNNDRIRYTFIFQINIIEWRKKENEKITMRTPIILDKEINILFETHKHTGIFSFNSGFSENHLGNITVCKSLVESQKDINKNNMIMIADEGYRKINAINGNVIIKYKESEREGEIK